MQCWLIYAIHIQAFYTFTKKLFKMTTGLLHLHNFLRWFALLAIIIAVIRSFQGMQGKKPFAKKDNLWSLLTLIAFHLQLVLGLALYFLKGWHTLIGEMSDRLIRFYSVEHSLGMLIAIVLVTIGRVSSKKMESDTAKHKKIFWYFFIALIITLVSIPWPFREIVGRPWFPGM